MLLQEKHLLRGLVGATGFVAGVPLWIGARRRGVDNTGITPMSCMNKVSYRNDGRVCLEDGLERRVAFKVRYVV